MKYNKVPEYTMQSNKLTQLIQVSLTKIWKTSNDELNVQLSCWVSLITPISAS